MMKKDFPWVLVSDSLPEGYIVRVLVCYKMPDGTRRVDLAKFNSIVGSFTPYSIDFGGHPYAWMYLPPPLEIEG